MCVVLRKIFLGLSMISIWCAKVISPWEMIKRTVFRDRRVRLALLGIRRLSRTRYECGISSMRLPHGAQESSHRFSSDASLSSTSSFSRFLRKEMRCSSALHRSIMLDRVPGWVLIIVTTLLSITTCYFYGSSHFYRDPSSIIFCPALAFENSYIVQRKLKATVFLKSSNSNKRSETP